MQHKIQICKTPNSNSALNIHLRAHEKPSGLAGICKEIIQNVIESNEMMEEKLRDETQRESHTDI